MIIDHWRHEFIHSLFVYLFIYSCVICWIRSGFFRVLAKAFTYKQTALLVSCSAQRFIRNLSSIPFPEGSCFTLIHGILVETLFRFIHRNRTQKHKHRMKAKATRKGNSVRGAGGPECAAVQGHRCAGWLAGRCLLLAGGGWWWWALGQQEAAAGEEEGERGLFKGRGGLTPTHPFGGRGSGTSFGDPPRHTDRLVWESPGEGEPPPKLGGVGDPPPISASD